MVNLDNPHFVLHSETNKVGGVMQVIAKEQDLFLNFGPNVKANNDLSRQRGSVFGLPYATAFSEVLRSGLLPPVCNLYGDFPGKPKNTIDLRSQLLNSSRVDPILVEKQILLSKATAKVEHQGVIISHEHQDAMGGVAYIKPEIPLVASKQILEILSLKEEKSARPQDEIFEIKRRDLPKVSGKYQIQERKIVPVEFGEEFALGEFKQNTLHNVDHTIGAAAIEVGMPNGGPRLINTLDMGVGQKTEKFIKTVWGDGPVDMLVLDATAIGGEKRFNEPQTNFRQALEERVYSYPQSNAFVEIPQRHLQRLVNLIEVGQKTKRKVFVPIDMAYYARNLLPAEMQDSFEIYLPQRYSRQYNPVDYQKGLREIAFTQDGQRLPGVLTIEELVTETAGEKSFVVLDNNNNLMQMLNAGDISHRNKTNPSTGKVDKFQNLLISAGYNYPNQLLKNAIIDASDNAGLIYKEINISDHIPENIMKEYLLNMTSKIILAVHTSNPASAREFVKRIQPNAIVPTISRSGLYEFVGGQKGIQKVDL